MTRATPCRTIGVAAAAALLLLTGCTPLVSVDQRALVIALAIDRGPCADGVTVTGQWYSSTPSLSVKGGMRPETKAVCASSVGLAIQELRGRAHRHLDFGVTGLVLIGRPLAAAGLADSLDTLWRDGDLPETAQVATIDGTAGSVLGDAPDNEQGFLLTTRLVDSFANNTGSVPITIWRFYQRMSGWPGDPWAPLLSADRTGVVDSGVAVYRQARLVTTLSGRIATAFGWLVKPGGAGDLTVRSGVDRHPITLRVIARRLGRRCAGVEPALHLTLLTRVREGSGVRVRGHDVTRLEQLAAVAAYADTARAIGTLIASGSDPLGLKGLDCGASANLRTPAAVRLAVTVSVRPDERLA